MSIPNRDEPKVTKLNLDTNLEERECVEDFYFYFERLLVKSDGRTLECPSKAEHEPEGPWYIYSNKNIIFYKYKEESVNGNKTFLVIIKIIDLDTLEELKLPEREQLKIFKELCSEDIKLVEFTPSMERKRVYFRVPQE